ncbi:MAG TPA: hypothetical protein VFW45_18030 [Candidatus Polarisedimenticolia bacterium]|nr:hypothetical protein [Candidatus Polarisedimenticolia bacterium]
MTVLPASRLTLFGFLLALPALYYALRFSSGFLRMLSRKFRKGRAYLQGSATDYALFAVGSWVAAGCGILLLAASTLQGGLQPYEGTREIGSIRAEAKEPGRMRLTLDLGETHPGHGKSEVDLVGARWALEGEFLDWRAVPRWLGFESGHRVESVLATSQSSGLPERDAESRAPVAGAYAPWYLAFRHPGWVPLTRTAMRRTPWMSADGGLFKIFVTDQGYVLVEKEGDRRTGNNAATPPEASGNR